MIFHRVCGQVQFCANRVGGCPAQHQQGYLGLPRRKTPCSEGVVGDVGQQAFGLTSYRGQRVVGMEDDDPGSDGGDPPVPGAARLSRQPLPRLAASRPTMRTLAGVKP